MECKLSTFECWSLYVAPWSPESRDCFAIAFSDLSSLENVSKNVIPVMVTCKNSKHPSVYQLDFVLVSPVTFPLAFLTCCHISESMGHADLTNSVHSPQNTFLCQHICFSFSYIVMGSILSPFSFLLPLPCWHCKKRIPLKGPEPLSLYAPDSNPGCNRHPTTSRKWEILGYNESYWIFFYSSLT